LLLKALRLFKGLSPGISSAPPTFNVAKSN